MLKSDTKDPDKEKGLMIRGTVSRRGASSFFRILKKVAGRLQAERLDRNQWKQYTAMMADSGRFVDILHGIQWQDGLDLDIANGDEQGSNECSLIISILAVESYIAKGRDGISDGVSGEGFLLENAKGECPSPSMFMSSNTDGFCLGFHVPAARGGGGGTQENRITLAAARYASEEAAALVHYAIALIEYTKLCQPLKFAKQRVEKLKQDLLDAEQKQTEKENEVRCLAKLEPDTFLATLI